MTWSTIFSKGQRVNDSKKVQRQECEEEERKEYCPTQMCCALQLDPKFDSKCLVR